MKYENMTITELLEQIGRIKDLAQEVEDLKDEVKDMSNKIDYLENEVLN